jgi:hypothetical protein
VRPERLRIVAAGAGQEPALARSLAEFRAALARLPRIAMGRAARRTLRQVREIKPPMDADETRIKRSMHRFDGICIITPKNDTGT